jgi:WD40 repeat protein
MKYIFLMTVFCCSLGVPKIWTQSNINDCNGKYICWLEKAKNDLKKDSFINAAYRFAAAQACDDAPVPDTLDFWINNAYQENIKYIEKQTKIANGLVKDAENQDVANNITGDFAQIMQNEDVTLQALLLHLACKKTQNTNKLAMRARREILSNPENRFYKRVEPVNTEGGTKTVISKDGSLIIQINASRMTLNKPNKIISLTLPPLINTQFSPNNKYFFIQTRDKGNMRAETYIASKTVNQKHSFCLYRTDEMTLIQGLETTEAIAASAFSQSSDSLIFVHYDGKISIRDLKNKINSENGQIKLEKNDVIDNLLMTHTGQRLLVSFKDGRIAMYNNKGKELMRFPSFHTKNIQSWDITEDDRLLITGGLDSSMTLWSLKNRAIWFGNKKYNNVVTSVGFSPNGKYNITSSLDKNVTIKDKEGTVVLNAQGHNEGVIACGFSAFGNTFYSLDSSKLKTWDFKINNYEKENYMVPTDNLVNQPAEDVSFSEDKKFAIRPNTEGGLIVSDAKKNTLYQFNNLNIFAFSPDNSFFVVAKEDSLFAWSLKEKELLWSIKSKMTIDAAFFSTNSYQNYLMLENSNSQKSELWKITNNRTAPQVTLKESINNAQFLAEGSLFYCMNKDYKVEIRKTNEPRTIVATLNEFNIKLYFSKKDHILYALYPSEIELENKVKARKYSLFEINTKDVEKNKKLQPTLYFDTPFSDNIVYEFSENGDSILLFKDKEIYIYPNTVKLLNDDQYRNNEDKHFPTVLDNKIKRKNGIMTDDDCKERGQIEEMMECSLFFASNVISNPNAMSQFDDMMLAMNVNKLSRAKIDTNELIIWQIFNANLTDIVSKYPYETNYKEKIKMTKQIINIKERILGETKSEDLGLQYGSLCWYILFDDSPDKIAKAIEYGEKSIKYFDEDWKQANLGHAYLFNNEFEKAQTQYEFFIDRLDDLFKDFDILEKADMVHPRMQEMRDSLTKLKN